MSEVAVSSPAPSAPSAPSAAPSSPSTGSTPSAAPAEKTSESRPQTSRESSREFLKKQMSEAFEKVKEPAPESESPESAETEEEGSEVAQEAQPQESQKAAEKPKEKESDDRLRIRETLKAIPDKKTREAIAELAFLGKDLRDTGIKAAEAKAYREMFTSPESARQASEVANTAYDLAKAYHSNTPDGQKYFLDNLRNANPAAYDSLVSGLVKALPETNRQAYRELGNRATRSVIGNLQRAAEQAARRGDEARAHEFATTAEILGEFVFPQGLQPVQRPANDPVVLENQRLKNEFQNFQQQRLESIKQDVFSRYHNYVQDEAARLLREADADDSYGERARGKMTAEVVNNVRRKIEQNSHIRMAVEGFFNNGDGRSAAEHLRSQASPLLASEVAAALKDFSEIFDKKQNIRESRQAVVVAKKDVGGPAAAPKAAPNKAVDTRGMDSKSALRALVKARLDARR
jgi:hypothetical protein